MSAEVVVYTTTHCAYCVATKRLLASKGAPFREIDVTHEPQARRWLAQASGQRTVPQIFINRVSVGGFQELAALDRKKELDPLLATPFTLEGDLPALPLTGAA